jgi:hypothetical protein
MQFLLCDPVTWAPSHLCSVQGWSCSPCSFPVGSLLLSSASLLGCYSTITRPMDAAVGLLAREALVRHHSTETRPSRTAERQNSRTTPAILAGIKIAAQKIPYAGNRREPQVTRQRGHNSHTDGLGWHPGCPGCMLQAKAERALRAPPARPGGLLG